MTNVSNYVDQAIFIACGSDLESLTQTLAHDSMLVFNGLKVAA